MNESAAQQETTEDPVFATAAPANEESPSASSSEAPAAEAAQPETTAEGAEARADLYKGMYDGDSGAANENAATPAADGERQGEQGEQKAEGEKSTLDKLKDTAISAGSKFGLKTALKLGAKVGGGLGGALAGGAVSAVENLQAYRDGKVSGLRAIGNTAVDAATGALPLGLGTVARWGLKKLGAYKPAS